MSHQDYFIEAGTADWIQGAAESLRSNGFCVLKGMPGCSLVPSNLCDNCKAAALVCLEEYTRLWQELGLDSAKDKIMFAEVCLRKPGCLRYDLAVPVLMGSCLEITSSNMRSLQDWHDLQVSLDRWARPVLQAFGLLDFDDGSRHDGLHVEHSGCDRAGCIISLPNSPDQLFHQDSGLPSAGSTGLITALVALVPVNSASGQTEFKPGSHIQADDLFGGGFEFMDMPEKETVRPDLNKGDILLFDYDVYHRGCANRGAEARPLAYIVYNRQGVSDKHNFPGTSLASAVALEKP